MRTPLAACLSLLLAASAASASLDKAREAWLRGRYVEAEEQYEKLLDDAKTRAAAAVGLSKAYASQGKYDKAQETVEKALKKDAKDTGLLARQAELLYFRGRWEDAEKAADAALAVDAKALLAKWVRAQIYRDRGDLKKAQTEVTALMDVYSETVNTDKEISDPESLLIVGLASSEDARWNASSSTFDLVLNDIYRDVIKSDRIFWPVKFQEGLLWLEKFSRGSALDCFDKVLEINASCAEALVAKGVVGLQKFEINDADGFAKRAMKINPELPEALRLQADVHFTTGDFAAARKPLMQARKVSPKDERTLARLAACEYLLGNQKEFDAIVAEVEKFDSKPAVFYYDLGEALEGRRRYDQAEKHFRKAMTLQPNLPGPLNSLGLLLMRTGDEEAAAPLLAKGFKRDPYNVRVKNMRDVLDHLANYKVIKTKHFLVKFDEKNDGILGPYVADQVEGLYDELAKKFDYKLEGPVLVEIFRSHVMFSGRVIALPDLHTIGACTGKVIAIASPQGKGVPKAYNWMRVLRHELVHVFNLAQTNYVVPHWFTEGLAVSNEGFPRQPAWNKMLVERYQSDRLLDLDTIDLAFIRPRDGDEWQQAYLQAQLYVEFMEKTYGAESIGKMLAEFAKGKNAVQAIAVACKANKADFEKAYRDYLGKVVQELRGGKAAKKRRTLAALEKAVKDNPNDADASAELAYRLLNNRRQEARKLAESALKNKEDHPRALFVLAMLERSNNPMKAIELLEKALKKDDSDPEVAKALGKMYYDGMEYDKAARVFELGRKADPYDKDWLVELGRVYAHKNDRAKQIEILKELVPLDADDLDRRVRLAKMLNEAGKFAEAEKYAREGLHIDVTNEEAREHLYKSLREQKKDDEVKKLQALLGDVAKKKEKEKKQ